MSVNNIQSELKKAIKSIKTTYTKKRLSLKVKYDEDLSKIKEQEKYETKVATNEAKKKAKDLLEFIDSLEDGDIDDLEDNDEDFDDEEDDDENLEDKEDIGEVKITKDNSTSIAQPPPPVLKEFPLKPKKKSSKNIR